jgi:hypothetical protein
VGVAIHNFQMEARVGKRRRVGLKGDKPTSRVLGILFYGFTNVAIHSEFIHDVGDSCNWRAVHLDCVCGVMEKHFVFVFPF